MVQEILYEPCGIALTNFQKNLEGIAYGACSFRLNEQVIEYRVSKITPRKVGQFVTIWQRSKSGDTEPFNVLDDLDFIIITSQKEHKLGQFVFPKSVLADKGIITTDGKEGKRGIRVYPPWDKTTSKQAIKTQNWQIQYFVTLEKGSISSCDLLKQIIKSK